MAIGLVSEWQGRCERRAVEGYLFEGNSVEDEDWVSTGGAPLIHIYYLNDAFSI